MKLRGFDELQEQDGWDQLVKLVQSSPDGLETLLEKYGFNGSEANVGLLIGIITFCRRQKLCTHERAISSLIGLTSRFDVWKSRHVPLTLISALYAAIYEGGLTSTSDCAQLALFIEQTCAQTDSTFPRMDLLEYDILELISCLFSCNVFGNVLSARPGLREAVTNRVIPLILENIEEYGALLSEPELNK